MGIPWEVRLVRKVGAAAGLPTARVRSPHLDLDLQPRQPGRYHAPLTKPPEPLQLKTVWGNKPRRPQCTGRGQAQLSSALGPEGASTTFQLTCTFFISLSLSLSTPPSLSHSPSLSLTHPSPAAASLAFSEFGIAVCYPRVVCVPRPI